MKIMTPRQENSQDLGFFNELDEDIRTRFLQEGRFVERQQGDYLVVQGQPLEVMSVIISGSIRLTVNSHGNTVTVTSLGSGDVFGEMSVIDPRQASATARVSGGPAHLWSIDYMSFNDFIASDEIIGFNIMKAMAIILCRKLRTNNENMLHQASDICSHFLEQGY
jgi:CRP-like cAMP-binding protein